MKHTLEEVANARMNLADALDIYTNKGGTFVWRLVARSRSNLTQHSELYLAYPFERNGSSSVHLWNVTPALAKGLGFTYNADKGIRTTGGGYSIPLELTSALGRYWKTLPNCPSDLEPLSLRTVRMD